jgi:drug/metabolite transporter (DMT)-like permease
MTQQTKAYLALAFICVVWGTTYLAIRIGVAHYPAVLFAAVRQLVAGGILLAVAYFARGKGDLSGTNVRRQMLMGFLMLTLGNGAVTWAEKYIPSGIAALICSMMPLFAVAFNLMSSKRDKFNVTIGMGMLLGLCGVGLIFRQNIADLASPGYLGGILCVILATAAWALGSSMNKASVKSKNPLFNSGLQLMSGGVFLSIMSPVVDDYSGMQVMNSQGMIALIYLIVFGSVLSYAAYMYVLEALPVGVATIYAYINPLIAVIAGYLVLNEALNIYVGMAFVTIVVSMFLVNRGYRQQMAAKNKIELKMAEAFETSITAES